jgi:transcriptional regulator with XRE-family HTH domain
VSAQSDTVGSAPRTDGGVAADVARLYNDDKSHREICRTLGLTSSQVARELSDLFAAGMPRRRPIVTDKQVRDIHAGYLRGESIDRQAEAMGVSASTVRMRIHKLNLPLRAQQTNAERASSAMHVEQREIARLLMARVDELRQAQGLSLERLAAASGLSVWTVRNLRRLLSDPRLSTVLRLAHGLGVTVADLVCDLPIPESESGAERRRGAVVVRGEDAVSQKSGRSAAPALDTR